MNDLKLGKIDEIVKENGQENRGYSFDNVTSTLNKDGIAYF